MFFNASKINNPFPIYIAKRLQFEFISGSVSAPHISGKTEKFADLENAHSFQNNINLFKNIFAISLEMVLGDRE